jgi:DNA polymerase
MPQHVLHRDIETRGVLDLRKIGPHKYAADPRTEVLCVGYAVDNEPARLWTPADPIPEEFLTAARDPDWIAVAHNDSFETAVETLILAPRFGWPLVPIERHVCTQARALALGLPARLSTLADVLELANRKDAAGERLMHQMARPRPPRKGEDPRGVYYFDDPDRLQRLGAYCCQDVEVEREVYETLPALSAAEQQLWVLSCEINNRGFHIDRGLIGGAKRIAAAAAPEIDAELAEITGGAVTKVSQVARILQWVRAHG